jgi:excisionase family DNA binding protein
VDTIMSKVRERMGSTEPTAADVTLARESERYLSEVKTRGSVPPIRLVTADKGRNLPVPESALRLVEDLIHRLAEGKIVVLSTEEEELTTQEAARLLNVSRPFLIGLVDAGVIPHRKVGTHRRIKRQHLLAYKASADAKAERAYAQLVAIGEEIGLDEGV